MSAFDYPSPRHDATGEVCAECRVVSLDEATYYHPVSPPRPAVPFAEPTPFCSRSCFLYWQWRLERAAS